MDGARLAILNKRFEAICAKMANTLFRTGRSGVLNTARDFPRCIITVGCGNAVPTTCHGAAPAGADPEPQDAAA